LANILVYIELADDSASWASLLALRQARYLATNVGATIYAVLPCATPPLYGENDIIAILSRQGADKVILMTHGDLTPPMLFQSHGEALLTAASQFPPALLLLPEGPAAVEIAPRVAARLGGLFVRHPRIDVQEGSSFRIDQPVFDDTHVRRFDSAELEHSVVAVVSPDPQQYAQALGTEEAEVVVIAPSFSGAETAAWLTAESSWPRLRWSGC
jgi:electron transfer flavoprotein alpha subunit